jgi:hypothetical protein
VLATLRETLQPLPLTGHATSRRLEVFQTRAEALEAAGLSE